MFQPLVVIGALVTIPLTIAEERGGRGMGLDLADWTIWAIFAADLVLLTATAERRSEYLRRNWLSIVVVVVSFPLLPAALAAVRVLRLLRLAAVVGAASPAIRATAARKGVLYVAGVTMLVMLAGAGGLTLFEPSLKGDFWAGLWWAVVTTTTVGYGDISPATGAGRVVAVVMMFVGIGLTATLAASVAAYFVKSDSSDDQLLARLDRIEATLKVLADRTVIMEEAGES